MSFRKEHALGPIALRGLEPELAGIEIHILDVEYDARAEPDARREQPIAFDVCKRPGRGRAHVARRTSRAGFWATPPAAWRYLKKHRSEVRMALMEIGRFGPPWAAVRDGRGQE